MMSSSANASVAQSLIEQLAAIDERFPHPRVKRLHIPRRNVEPGSHDAEFCAIELADGAFGLSYVLLGDTLQRILQQHGGDAPLEGANPMALARQLLSSDAVERAVALAAINALTDSVWRRSGYAPPSAGNSLGDVELGKDDHLGMIGFFPPLVRRIDAVEGRLTVVEMSDEIVARQKALYPNVRITTDRSELAQCNVVVGTSTMLLNDTLDDMLAAAPSATAFAVIGPSAGLWPDVLFDRGVTLLGGTRIEDANGFAEAMASGESWSKAARKFAIAKADWPGWQVVTGMTSQQS